MGEKPQTPLAAYQEGLHHLYGLGIPVNPLEARKLFTQAANEGLPQAQELLAIMYFLGLGGPRDVFEARRLFTLAANRGQVDSQFSLGVMLYLAEGGPQDIIEARRQFGLAVDRGHVEAHVLLAVMTYLGQGGEKNPAECRRLFSLARDKLEEIDPKKIRITNEKLQQIFNNDILFILGYLMWLGEGGPEDHFEARRLLEKVYSGKFKNPVRPLATMLHYGFGGPPDQARARRLLKQEMDRGNKLAQFPLALMLLDSDDERDFAEARRLLSSLARLEVASAKYQLFILDNEGKSDQDYKTGNIGLLRMAAKEEICPEALLNLGLLTRDGRDVGQDQVEARRLLRLAANLGSIEARYHLALMHYRGQGGPDDPAEARRHFTLASERGSAPAQYNLGVMLYQGQGGPVDHNEAVRQFTLAAGQGLEAAQEALTSLEQSEYK